MPTRQFDPAIVAALDAKAVVDLALIELRRAVSAGEIPYSASALLSAVERCDEAMHALWAVLKPIVLKTPR